MNTITTTTVTPAAPTAYAAPATVPQPAVYAPSIAAQHPAYAPPLAYAPAQAPAVASSYTLGSSPPHNSHLKTSLPSSVHQLDGYHTVLGDTYKARGEYDLYLNALNASTPILNKAREELNVPVGWDISKNELAPHQIVKKYYLKEFKREIIRLVDEQRAARPVVPPRVVHTVPATVPARSVPAAPLPQLM